jgi:hypothetical protein
MVRRNGEIDHLGAGALATDWGSRLLSDRSDLYDPLSYHYGSVWPLFTGWSAMAAYRYGRPHVGYQALMANVLLTFSGALGYVTELLSGDFNSAFGRSSHHQIWSEAMVVTPIMRGLLGVEVTGGGRELRFAPQLPADWDRVSATSVPAGHAKYDLTLERGGGRMTITVSRQADQPSTTSSAPRQLVVSPAFPLDAVVRGVTVNGKPAQFTMIPLGDVQQAQIVVPSPAPQSTIALSYIEGSDVCTEIAAPAPGAENTGLRILRSTASKENLRLVLEGRGGRSYTLFVRTARRIGEVPGVTLTPAPGGKVKAVIAFDGPSSEYARREIVLPLTAR